MNPCMHAGVHTEVKQGCMQGCMLGAGMDERSQHVKLVKESCSLDKALISTEKPEASKLE